MEKTFWEKFKKPFVGQAPMDGITDAPFRAILAKYGKPDLFFTEFTSVEGICAGAIKPLKAFKYCSVERPIIAQLFGSTPECFYNAFFLVAELGFDGVDINMGCPSRTITTKGAGASLINNPKLSAEIIKKCKEAKRDYENGKTYRDVNLPDITKSFVKNNRFKTRQIPISVKTRIGYNKNDVKNWIGFLLDQGVSAIEIHGRTYKQMYGGTADWEAIALASKLASGSNTIIVGNGDIRSAVQALKYAKTYNTKGVLIGRGALGKPWVFNKKTEQTPSQKQIFKIALEHCYLKEKLLPEEPFLHIRKHLAWYLKGFKNASELRKQVMKANNSTEVKKLLNL